MGVEAFQAGASWRQGNERQAVVRQAHELNLAEFVEKKAEKARQESLEAQSLRKLMAIYQPERKDEFTTMNLGDLRGESMAFAGKAALDKQRREEMKAQQEEQSTAALGRVLQDAGSLNESEVLAQGNGPVRATRQPVAMTPQRLQAVLARNPAAVNAENFAPTINALRALMADSTTAGGAGPVEFTTDPETGTRYGFNRKTGQFGVDPNSRAKATADAEAGKARFSVEPIMDKFGRPAGYGVKAQFGSEDEAKAWADKQNQTSKADAASEYKSAEEVKAALKAKKLTKEAAVEILRKQFGYQ